MRVLHHELGAIRIPTAKDSLKPLEKLMASADYWAADTESTGLKAFSDGYRVRLVQVGTDTEAWCLDPLIFPADAIAPFITTRDTWWHNMIFDAMSVEQSLGIDFDLFMDVAHDTEILARLLDPRPVQKGGSGHKLDQLMGFYLGLKTKVDARRALHDAYGSKRKVPIGEIFANIPVDNETYLLYAGNDIFGTARLARCLDAKVRATGNLRKFYEFERPLARRLAQMQRLGTAFDTEWAAKAEAEFTAEFQRYEDRLIDRWKVNQGGAAYAHSGNAGLIKRFDMLGVTWKKFTEPSKTHPEGQISLDKSVLDDLSTRSGDIGALARDILAAKQNKHYAGYIAGMRDNVGKDGRIHPNIRPMQAATHRMSISDPPIQQFPRGDDRPRGCLIADPGEVILCVDMDQIEMRVGAAVSQDPVMIGKIRSGDDLHAVTATALFGADWPARMAAGDPVAKEQRQAAKPVGFGRLYLGSAQGIRDMMLKADTTGQVPSLLAVKRAIKAFDSEYRVYNRWALRLKDKVENDNGKLITATGRYLRVDVSFAAANYMIQSTARDLFAAGINAIHKRGYGHMLRLVVHDECVLSVPRESASEIAAEIVDCMTMTFKGVPMTVTPEIKHERWVK